MEKLPLTEADIRTIRFAKNQVLISFSAIGLIVTILTIVFALILSRSTIIEPSNKDLVLITLVTFIAVTFIFFVYKGLRDYIKDLRSGIKSLIRIEVDEKNSNTNWGYHANIAADLQLQPKLDEFYIFSGEHRYSIPEEIYKELKEGDTVEIEVTNHSGIILEVKKL